MNVCVYILFIYLPDSLIIYFAKFDCKLNDAPQLSALLYAGCAFLSFVKFKLLKKIDDDEQETTLEQIPLEVRVGS